MYAKSVCKAPVSRLAISAWRPACLVVLLSLGTFARTSPADTGAEGTWNGTWVRGDAVGITFEWTLESDGSMTGCWRKSLEPWVSATITACVSGTYRYYSRTGVLSIQADGWKYNVQGYDIYIETNIDGTVSGNSASGNSSTSYDIYQRGHLVGSDTDESTWQATRVSSVVVIYVDAGASPGGDGLSWGTAYKYLQDGLANANVSGDDIWVAAGTYKPDEDDANPGGSSSQTDTFQLIDGVGIYGGFAGDETSLDERDWATNETILRANRRPVPPFLSSYHVVTGSGTNANAVLDGFTITAGNADGSNPHDRGGGMYNYEGSPTVTNCTFSGNIAYYGGGMYNNSSSPTVTNCAFSSNSAETGGGMFNDSSSPTVTNCAFSSNSAYQDGGGMYNDEGSPTVTNCTFSSNSAYEDGGGMYNYKSSPTVTGCTFSDNLAADYGGGMLNGEGSPTVTNCTFSGNSASRAGGGMYNNGGNPTVTNCMFSGNSADLGGGGMCNYDFSNPTVTNCTFSGNRADFAFAGGGMYNHHYSNPALTNCILWGNTAPGGAQIYNDGTSSTAVNYCCVEDWSGGGWGNIGDDPNFVDPNGPDEIVGTEDDNIRLSADSNCIDAGDNTAIPPDTVDLDEDGNTSELTPLDLDGQDRFVDDPNTSDTGVIILRPVYYTANVDMGAYEWYGGPGCGDAEHPYPPGDLSGPDGVPDCFLDFYDFAVWAAHWMEYTGPD